MAKTPERGRTTIADVAREAGVSKGLVSFALNDRPGVAPDTRDRIMTVARELGWRPSARARALSAARSSALGLVIARDPAVIAADPFFPSFIAGLESALAPAGQVLVLCMARDERTEREAYRQLAGEDRVDGVILTDLRHDDWRIALVHELGLRAVTLGRPSGPSPFPAVCVDDAAGIRAVIDHLVDLGHRRIAHVAGPARMLHGTRRRASYESAMRAIGAEAVVVETDFSAADGARATSELLALGEPPTAIVYANDPMAIAGIGVAQRAGLVVPDDLSVTGFDGSEVGAYLHPALTTVTTAVSEWGRATATSLLALIAGDDVADVELDPARLEVRESTTTPPGHPTAP